jgi:hypothetical protein
MKILSLSLVLLALACQSAPAVQDREPRESRQHLTANALQDATKTRQHAKGFSQVTINDDEHGELSLTLQRNGTISAQLDGRAVPSDQIVREGDHVRVLDSDGHTLYGLQVVGENEGLAYPYGTSSRAFGGRIALESLQAKPRHVIGVITSPVDAALAAQLGLEPDTAIIINEVTPDMPAATAGLLPFDVITHIDGAAPVTRDVLRERVAATAVGSPLKLTLLRRGQPQEIEVSVGETTDEMGLMPRIYLGDQGGEGGAWNVYGESLAEREELERAHVELERARESLEQRMAELRDTAARGGAEGEAAKVAAEQLELAHRSLAEAEEAMKNHAEGMPPEVRFFDVGAAGDKGLLLRARQQAGVGQDAWRPLTGSAEDRDAKGAADEKIRKLEERLAQLDARVAELVTALEAAQRDAGADKPAGGKQP